MTFAAAFFVCAILPRQIAAAQAQSEGALSASATPIAEDLAMSGGRERNEPPPATAFNMPAKQEATGSQTRWIRPLAASDMSHFNGAAHKDA